MSKRSLRQRKKPKTSSIVQVAEPSSWRPALVDVEAITRYLDRIQSDRTRPRCVTALELLALAGTVILCGVVGLPGRRLRLDVMPRPGVTFDQPISWALMQSVLYGVVGTDAWGSQIHPPIDHIVGIGDRRHFIYVEAPGHAPPEDWTQPVDLPLGSFTPGASKMARLWRAGEIDATTPPIELALLQAPTIQEN